MKHPGIKKLLSIMNENFAIITPDYCKNAHEDLKNLINDVGRMSSQAQGLSHTITTFGSFLTSDHKIYMLFGEKENEFLGFAKTGPKNLFLWKRAGSQEELRKICLLDFFVHPGSQRKGYGKIIMDYVLKQENLEMKDIPIDRPSMSCLRFMSKNYNLKDFLPQSNQYVVFDEFWPKDDKVSLPSLYDRKTPRLASNAILNKTSQNTITKNRYNQKRTGLNPITWLPY